MQNFEKIATSDLRKAGLLIAEAGLRAIDTEKVVREAVRVTDSALVLQGHEYLFAEAGRIFLYGVGKCSTEAVSALSAILGDRVTGGVLIDVKEGNALPRIISHRGTHPAPSEINVRAARHLAETLQGFQDNDLVIFCISGGASTLLCLPEGDMDCETESSIFRTLTKAGATIQELNTVRKHLSRARGGHLARLAYPARVHSLIFSDVPGDDIQFIASGPTVRDETTIEDAKKILLKYDVAQYVGRADIPLIETPKEEKYFDRVINEVLVSNKVALQAMAAQARELGYAADIRTHELQGEAREVAKRILEEAREAPSKSVLLYGGETTVTIQGKGKGGRNMELALSGLRFVSENECLISVASDGRDNTDFAGGVCDIISREKARAAGLDLEVFLRENNAYEFFGKVGDFIITGNTGSNVSDLIVAIKE